MPQNPSVKFLKDTSINYPCGQFMCFVFNQARCFLIGLSSCIMEGLLMLSHEH